MSTDISLLRENLSCSPFRLKEFKNTSPLKRFHSFSKEKLFSNSEFPEVNPDNQSTRTSFSPLNQTLSHDNSLSLKNSESIISEKVSIHDQSDISDASRSSTEILSFPYKFFNSSKNQNKSSLECNEHSQTQLSYPFWENNTKISRTKLNQDTFESEFNDRKKITGINLPLDPQEVYDSSNAPCTISQQLSSQKNSEHHSRMYATQSTHSVEDLNKDSDIRSTGSTSDSSLKVFETRSIHNKKENKHETSLNNTTISPSSSNRKITDFPAHFKEVNQAITAEMSHKNDSSRFSDTKEEVSPSSDRCALPETENFFPALHSSVLSSSISDISEKNYPVYKEHDVQKMMDRLRITEEKVVELETDKEFLTRECQELREKLKGAMAREEELESYLSEAAMVSLRDRQALEARHRDSISELRRLLHEESSKVEGLQDQLREKQEDSFDERKNEKNRNKSDALDNSILSINEGCEMEALTLKLMEKDDQLYYWKTEASKLAEAYERNEMEFRKQFEEYEKNNCYLKEQLNERNEEIVKLTGDLKKTTRALERMTYNRQAESKEIEETIDLLKEKVHALQTDCHQFQKVLKRKEQEHAYEIGSLCDQFSKLKESHEEDIERRVAERELFIQQELERRYEAKLDETCATLKSKYYRLLEKYKYQWKKNSRSHSSDLLKTYIKSEISKVVAETVHRSTKNPAASVLCVRASCCQENDNLQANIKPNTTFVLGTAVASNFKSQQSSPHDRKETHVYQRLSPERFYGGSTQSHNNSEIKPSQFLSSECDGLNRTRKNDFKKREETCSSCIPKKKSSHL